ncbi:MAG TPA: plastocyanin/azurin family copper-binding protein [Frankiaceae bacterium]|nr:plastocyanin/azurin family copper-binding protein [Frankiaceae bacterium]
MTRRLAVLLLVLVAALSLPVPAFAATVTVTIGGSLSPKSLTVVPGTTVTWRNADDERHRPRSTSGPAEFDADDLEPGESWSFTFRVAGTYRYVDHRDEDVSAYWGTVTVSSGSSGGSSGGGGTGGGGTGGGGGGGGATAPGSATVTMAGRTFSPSSVRVSPGGTVTFVNDDDREHTATARDGSFDSGVLNAGGRWSRRFPSAGTFGYFCAIHPDMTGTVTVPSANGSVPPPAPARGSTARPGGSGGGGAAPAPSPPPVRVPGKPSTVRVNVVDFAYSPARASARVGDTVVWTNVGQAPHTVTPSGGGFGTSMLAAGAAYRWVPARTGTFSYVCAFHPQMTGTLTVLPKSAAPPRNGTATAPRVRPDSSPSASPSGPPPPALAPAGSAGPEPSPSGAGGGDPRARSLRPVSSGSPLVVWTVWGALALVAFLALAWWRGREVPEAAA